MRSMSVTRWDLIPPEGEIAEMDRFVMGLKKYGKDNWRLGIPYSNVLSHLENHLKALKIQLLMKPSREKDLALELLGNTDTELGNIGGIRWATSVLANWIHHGNPAETNNDKTKA
jgi:hypothetical protein